MRKIYLFAFVFVKVHVCVCVSICSTKKKKEEEFFGKKKRISANGRQIRKFGVFAYVNINFLYVCM